MEITKQKQRVSVFVVRFLNGFVYVEISKEQKTKSFGFHWHTNMTSHHCVLVNSWSKEREQKTEVFFFHKTLFLFVFLVLIEFFNKTKKSDVLNLSNTQRCTKLLKLTLFLRDPARRDGLSGVLFWF